MRKNLINKYINEVVKENSKGLFLITAPTGYGKTYQVAQFIKNNHSNKTIIYLANQVKYIEEAQTELFNILDPEEVETVKKKTVLFKSIFDTYCEIFLKLEFCPKFKESNENRNAIEKIKGIITAYKSNKNSNDPLADNIGEMIYESFHGVEMEFRLLIKKYISTENDIPEWAIKLYPAANLEKYSIIFMTTKKFFYPLDPLRGKSFYFYDKEINNAVVFIDEIDSTKKELLDVIIGNENNEKVDLFRLYRRIDEAIVDDSIYTDYPFDQNNSRNYAREPIQNIRKYFFSNNDFLSSLTSDNNSLEKSPLKFAFKTTKFNVDKSFLFNDGYCMTFCGNRDKVWFNYYFNEDKIRNDIEIESTKLRNNIETVYEVCLDVVNYFIAKVACIVPLYKKFYEIQEGKSISITDVCSSILKRMNLGDENVRFLIYALKAKLMNVSRKKDLPIDNDLNYHLKKNDFYYRGFSYLQVIDTVDDHLESQMISYNYSETPEHYLINLAKNFHVVGLSATAQIDSAISNYDLDYIQHILGDDYKVLSEAQLNKIKSDYENSKISAYKHTNFEIEIIDKQLSRSAKNDSKEYLRAANISELCFQNHICSVGDEGSNLHYLKQCGDLYRVLDKFMNNKHLHSFIYFSNNNWNNWGKLTATIKETIHILYGDKLNFVILDAKMYKNKELSKLLKRKEKIFIVSAYNTIGVGVNLQYIPNEESESEKDVDGIFLSEPTNVISTLQNHIVSRNELSSYFYAIEYLKIRDAISYKKRKSAIEYGFNRYNLKPGNFPFPLDDITEIGLAKLKVIIQALGRISRTNYEKKHIQIFTTENVVKTISKFRDHFDSTPQTIEFSKLLEFVKSKIDPYPPLVDYIQVKEATFESQKLISSYVSKENWKWNAERMKEWSELRDFVLKHPTAEDDSLELIKKHYIHFHEPVFEYSVNNSYYVSKIANNRSQCRKSISKYSANLDVAMKYHFIRESFEELGYATEFKQGKYILSTPMFYSIYKGAIGEQVGKFVLKKYGMDLSEIEDPNIFELFDFHYNGFIYFDFKNWDIDMRSKMSEHSSLKNILNKNRKAKSTTIFIVNVFYEGYHEINEYSIDDIKVVTIPWLIRGDKKINQRAIAKILEETKRYENIYK